MASQQIYLEVGQVHEVELEGDWEHGLFWRETRAHDTECVHTDIRLTGATNKSKLRITALKVGLCRGGDGMEFVKGVV